MPLNSTKKCLSNEEIVFPSARALEVMMEFFIRVEQLTEIDRGGRGKLLLTTSIMENPSGIDGAIIGTARLGARVSDDAVKQVARSTA